jgi:nucleotide-binding universal stress UspA family protein
MFKQILVPVDLTDAHGRALEIAAGLAGPVGGQVTVLHVIELIAGLSQEEGKDFYGRLEKKARAHLADAAARLAPSKVASRTDIVFGHRAAQVVRYAQEYGSDLIVLTSHRFDPQQGLAGLGTLSHQVGILSPCPVLLVK